MKDDLYITETSGPRFELAIERLSEGHSFIFQRVALRRTSHSHIECAMHSSWGIADLSDELARKDFAHAKSVFLHLRSASPEFAELVDGKPVVYSIVEDYGTGCVELCRLDGDQLQWADDLRMD